MSYFLFFLLILKSSSLQFERCLDKSRLLEATNRVFGTATVVGDDVYLIGGILNYGYKYASANRYIYKITFNSCEDIKSELKHASIDLYFHAAVYIPSGLYENCILIFGGETHEIKEYESILYYNISSDTLENITTAEFPFSKSKAYYLDDLKKVVLVGGSGDYSFNSISYFDLNTQEIETYTENTYSSAKRQDFASSLNKIENINGGKDNIITYYGGHTTDHYIKSLYQYNTSVLTNVPSYRKFEPDINREYSEGVGWRNYLVIHGGTYYYSDNLYLAHKTLFYDIKNNKMLEDKNLNRNLGIYRHNSILLKKDLLVIFGGLNTNSRYTDYFTLNLSQVSLQDAKEDVSNPLMYYLIGAACVVVVGVCMCCTLYCMLSYLARRRYEQQVIGIERMLNGAPPRTVPEDLLNVITKELYTPNKFHHQTCCTICILDFEENEKIKVLPCQHIFHYECIDQWLHHKDICPVCKREVLNERGSRIASTVPWEEKSDDEVKPTQQVQMIEMKKQDSVKITVGPPADDPVKVAFGETAAGNAGTTTTTTTQSPVRKSTSNSRKQVVTPTSISVHNNSANNSINNSLQFQPPNMPFDDLSGI